MLMLINKAFAHFRVWF